MYIPWGQMTARRPLGRVADFCPFCRGFQPFEVARLESVKHFYFRPFGSRVPMGDSKACETCGLRRSANLADYAAIATEPHADLDELIRQTNPEIARRWASRMLLEDRIKARKLTAGERSTLLHEPFTQAAEVLARRDLDGQLDMPSHIGCLGTLILPLACLLIMPLVWVGPAETVEWAVVGVAAFCVGFTFLAIVTDARRHARREVLPRLVEAIRPLDPSAEEIETIHQSLREAQVPLAEVINPREVSNALLERWE